MMTRSLLSSLQLPSSGGQRRGLAIDGVGGISQRGPLQRLLLSELALDDELLARRIALTEALYLDREPPLLPRRKGRTLLVDSGLRLWGSLRLFSTSVALALVELAQREAQIDCYRCHGSELILSELTHAAGLLQFLQGLCSDLHPGAALKRWVEGRSQSSEIDVAAEEVIVVTSTLALADPEFRLCCRDMGAYLGGLLLATVDRQGGYQLFVWEGQRERLLQRVEVVLPATSGGSSG